MEEERRDEDKRELPHNSEPPHDSERNSSPYDDVEPNESIEERIPSERIEEEPIDDLQNQIQRLNEKTEALHADEEFLKEELKVRERETLEAYLSLMGKKKRLLQLVQTSFNRKAALVDISLTEELEELRRVIGGQQGKIEQLRGEIGRKGLAGVLNDESSVRIKNKSEEMEKEIKVGRKFSSTQYVRDYLERPQAYKVSYEEAKHEFELRLRVKESLEQEKQLFERRKEELTQAKKRERELEQQLLKDWDALKR